MAVDEDAVGEEARLRRAGSPVPDRAGSPVPDVESAVLDLSVLSPEDVAALPDTVLGATLRRVYDSCAEGDPFVTGHKESTT
ncbi:FxSxx-COOH cyclophane-containing RiPP peptide [Streptomyces sp. NPDC048179]|uniref:FxSxx-COOH cyclophane-containing RiPP peptide n=1 Tax=unclassified Streptomyces TaxID=2593676 RepID=UPI00341D48FF